MKKNFDGALVEYKKAVQMAPKGKPGPHYRLGKYLLSLANGIRIEQLSGRNSANDPSSCTSAKHLIGNVLRIRARGRGPGLVD